MPSAKTRMITLPEASEMMTCVRVDEKNRKLHVLFGDGMWVCVPVDKIERAGKPVRLDLDRIALSDPHVLLIGVKDGGQEEIPSDFIRYLGDPEFARSQKEKEELSRQAFGNRVRRLREQADLTQLELARRADVSRLTILRIENGQMYARTETLRRIAKALDTSLAHLIAAD